MTLEDSIEFWKEEDVLCGEIVISGAYKLKNESSEQEKLAKTEIVNMIKIYLQTIVI